MCVRACDQASHFVSFHAHCSILVKSAPPRSHLPPALPTYSVLLHSAHHCSTQLHSNLVHSVQLLSTHVRSIPPTIRSGVLKSPTLPIPHSILFDCCHPTPNPHTRACCQVLHLAHRGANDGRSNQPTLGSQSEPNPPPAADLTRMEQWAWNDTKWEA